MEKVRQPPNRIKLLRFKNPMEKSCMGRWVEKGKEKLWEEMPEGRKKDQLVKQA